MDWKVIRMLDEGSFTPLSAKRVLVTRAQHQSASVCARIRAYGGEAVSIPLIDYHKTKLSTDALRTWLEAVQQADWVIFTSQNSLDFFMRLSDRPDQLDGVKRAVVGKKTAERLKYYGMRADYIPDPYSVQGLLNAFETGVVKADRIVVPLGSRSDKGWLEKLKSLGIKVTSCVLYQTTVSFSSKARLEEVVGSGYLSAITFASPSAVHSFTELLPESSWRSALKSCTIAVIGSTTAQALEALGYTPDVLPKRFTAVDMIDALANYYSKEEGSPCNEQQS
ncbi:uroporphyrinogen-III synthase [Sporolactobacillus kofuensis]|uniref:Uroporphyrinogen-III synthase n=1 Tax=Sporolactobacillus kofuensis TaxID=269672 RepID=A0ABW1WHR6_9BACL|nr:uroporphyrinogen-III synthase [Sporolactobacillus kofuensis]MCO7176116.1 uroporphyrinogen-III synthase [Sporolactobacillus kofuensis]